MAGVHAGKPNGKELDFLLGMRAGRHHLLPWYQTRAGNALDVLNPQIIPKYSMRVVCLGLRN
jgi:hypothetical protein